MAITTRVSGIKIAVSSFISFPKSFAGNVDFFLKREFRLINFLVPVLVVVWSIDELEE